MMRVLPRTMAGRAVLVLVIGVLVSQLAALMLFAGERRSLWSGARGHFVAERMAAVAAQVESLARPERGSAAVRLGGAGVTVFWSGESLVPEAVGGTWDTLFFRRMMLRHMDGYSDDSLRVTYAEALPSAWHEAWQASRRRAGPRAGMRMGGRRHGMAAFSGVPVFLASLRLAEGDWLNFVAPAPGVAPIWASRFFAPILLATLVVAGLSVWAVRRATRPLGMLAAAAARLGTDVNAPEIPEGGPREVARAAKAFNEMQRRLRGFVEDRTQMLAAISHDLRTPITRLRLRAEFMEDGEQREKMLADLDEMETMIAATLFFARDDAAREPRTSLDLAALLQSLVSDRADSAADAHFDGPDHLEFQGRPLSLKRAFDNLIGNALKYGHTARVGLIAEKEGVHVSVDDDGPGLPAGELERVFTPFYRVERSRSRETGGVGLGLSVVRSVIRAHGGEVTLVNRAEGGLRATVTLPILP